MNTVIGQGLDLVTPPKKTSETEPFDFANYTQEQYDSIVKWKTAYYSFCLPVQSALYLVNIDDAQVHSKCREILLEMGYFFQVQDDYLDCCGDPKVTGKVGTDIEESKCSWLVIQALRKSTPEQKKLLEVRYHTFFNPFKITLFQLKLYYVRSFTAETTPKASHKSRTCSSCWTWKASTNNSSRKSLRK
jgi:geranylgeranyl pyrophosphate synthase